MSSETQPAGTPPPVRAWLPLWLGLAVIWGSSFLLMKYGLQGFSPIEVALGRTATGFAAVLVFVLVARKGLPHAGIAWLHCSIVAVFLCIVPFTLFAWAETRVSSLLAGLFNAGTPLFTALAGLVILRGDKVGPNRTLGLFLGLAGVIIMMSLGGSVSGTIVGSLAAVGATVCYGIGIQWTRRFLGHRPEGAESLVAAQLLVAALALGVIEALSMTRAPSWSPVPVIAIIVLGAVGTGLAFLMNFQVIKVAGALTSSTVTYATPIVSTVLGIVVLGEGLTWNQPVGAALVLVGVALVQGFLQPLRSRAGETPTTDGAAAAESGLFP